ncbi:MAG: patatin-like phospholipase family protein, partial [Actinomycetes bacterium]
AVFAAHPLTAVARLADIWTNIAGDSSLSSTWRGAVRGLAGNQSARTANMLTKHLDAALNDRAFDSVEPDLQLVATDLATGLPAVIRSGLLTDAVLASCAFPVMMPPATRNGRLLTDGSVTAGVPVDQALTAGARSIVLFDTGASAVSDQSLIDIVWYQVMAIAFTHLVRGQAAHDLAQVAAEIPVVVISCDLGNPIDLKSSPSLLSLGRRVGQLLLDSLPADITEPGIYGLPIGLADADSVSALIKFPPPTNS